MNIVSWLPQYQRRIDQAIGDFFDARYSGEEAVEKTFEEAIRYAVE